MPRAGERRLSKAIARAADRLSEIILFPKGPVTRTFLRIFERVGLVVML